MAERPRIQPLAIALSLLFIGIGILGFIPGITTHAPGDFWGHGSHAKLLGLFQVSVVHNLFHMSYGVVGLIMARSVTGAKVFVFAGGLGLMALWLAGVLGLLDWLPANTAHHWLHLVDGALMVIGGIVVTRSDAQSRPVPATP